MELMEVIQGGKQTDVGEIPLDWSVVALSDACIKVQDGTHFSPRIGGRDYLYVTSKNVRFGYLELSSAEMIDSVQHRNIYKRCDVRFGDLLLTKDGASTGNAALNTVKEEFSLLSSVALLRFDNRQHNARFFLQQILSSFGQRQIQEAMAGNAITRLTLEKINKLKFPVPPILAEQKAIAEALSDADALIESLEQLIAKKRQIKKGAMQELLTGKRRLPGFEGEWAESPLGELLRSYRLGGNYTNTEEPTPYPLMKMGNVGRGGFNTAKLEYVSDGIIPNECDRLKNGDILFNTRNTLELVGKVAVWRDELPVAYFNSNLLRLDFDGELVGSQFFMNFVMNSSNVLRQFREMATGTTSVAAIYTRDLLRATIFFPVDRDEQSAVAIAIEAMEDEIAALESTLAKYRQIKQGMMHNLLTGKVRLV